MRSSSASGGMDLLVWIGLAAIAAAAVAGSVLYVGLLGTLLIEHGLAGVAGAPNFLDGAATLVRGILSDSAHPWHLYRGHYGDINPALFWTISSALFLGALTVGLGVYAYLTAPDRALFRSAASASHGDSRWANRWDRRALGRRARASSLKPDGIVLGWLGRRVLQSPAEDNALVFGVQRSGKTSTVVVPTLLGWRGAAVATSTKEELVRLTGPYRARLGPVWVFAPVDRDTTWITDLGLSAANWNPVADAYDPARAIEIADLFTSEGKQGPSAHWYLAASNLIGGLILAAHASHEDLRSVVAKLNNLSLSNFVSLAAQQRDPVAKELLTAFVNTPSREAGSVASTARSCLALWLDNRIASATAAEPENAVPLDLDELLETGGTLYLVAPAEEAERCRPLFTALLQSLLAAATRRARRMPRGVLSPRLLLALDEVANFARIPRLGGYTSTGPGQGIQVLLCLHDLAQLEGAYGAEQARTIWNNCRARLLLPSQGDLRTLEQFSRAIGDETRAYDLSSWASDGRRSRSEQRIGRPLATLDSLRRMRQPVLLFASSPPAQLRARRWDQVGAWRNLVDADNGSARRGIWPRVVSIIQAFGRQPGRPSVS
ncbi:MAG TPA: type IV secretory system conjugative DNA transfer family protein [Candidatus Dormibacteraeota bacterium]|nr:type IV secretory system conjugative DNA transfer family protein [Candidatus Dormibacteraeota bacterium]